MLGDQLSEMEVSNSPSPSPDYGSGRDSGSDPTSLARTLPLLMDVAWLVDVTRLLDVVVEGGGWT